LLDHARGEGFMDEITQARMIRVIDHDHAVEQGFEDARHPPGIHNFDSTVRLMALIAKTWVFEHRHHIVITRDEN